MKRPLAGHLQRLGITLAHRISPLFARDRDLKIGYQRTNSLKIPLIIRHWGTVEIIEIIDKKMAHNIEFSFQSYFLCKML